MRNALSLLLALTALALPASTSAARPEVVTSVTASAVTAAVGSGCAVSATATWDRVRVEAIRFVVMDSSGVNNGFVEQGDISLAKAARGSSLQWSSTNTAQAGAVTVYAVFIDARGAELTYAQASVTCP